MEDTVTVRFVDSGREFRFLRGTICAHAPETIFARYFDPASPWHGNDEALKSTFTVDRDQDVFSDYIAPYLRGYGRVWEMETVNKARRSMLEKDLDFYGVEPYDSKLYQSLEEGLAVFRAARDGGVNGGIVLGPFRLPDVSWSMSYRLVPESMAYLEPEVESIYGNWVFTKYAAAEEGETTFGMVKEVFLEEDYLRESAFWSEITHAFNGKLYVDYKVGGSSIEYQLAGAFLSKTGIPEIGLTAAQVSMLGTDIGTRVNIEHVGAYVHFGIEWLYPCVTFYSDLNNIIFPKANKHFKTVEDVKSYLAKRNPK